MTDLIKDAGDNPPGEDGKQNQQQEPGDSLAALVGDGKRYRDAEALAKGRLDADAHIARLEAEAKEKTEAISLLENRADEGATMKDILEHLKAGNSDDPQNQQEPVITEEAIADLVESRMDKRDDIRSARTNREVCNTALLSKFDGNKTDATEHLRSKSAELKISIKELQRMSEQTPGAFKRLLDIDQNRGSRQEFRSPNSTGATGAGDTGAETRNASYYKALKKEVGFTKYYTPAIQQQRFKDMEALGDSFNK
jgi:hypothetical protein